MIAARSLKHTHTLGFYLIAVSQKKVMTSVAATTSSNQRGLHASASRAAAPGSPQRRLQRLTAVPGSSPRRVNDLLLLLLPDKASPSAGYGVPGSPGSRSNKHAVFFHGDIQVRVWGVIDYTQCTQTGEG